MIIAAVKAAQIKLIEAGLGVDGDFKGCTEEEIRSVEDLFGIRLPLSYRGFLRVMGHGAGDFLIGSDYSFPKMLGFRDGAEELLRQMQSGFTLSATSFVFISHQGYNFLWFDCSGQAVDPAIFLITELEKEPRKVAESFSAWLLSAVDDDITAYRELGKGRKE